MQAVSFLFSIGTQSRCLLTGPVSMTIKGLVEDNQWMKPSAVSGDRHGTSLGYLAFQKPSIHYPERV